MAERWTGDERGRGVGDAHHVAEGADHLLEAMRRSGWVAEDPEAHLLPHIEGAIEGGAPFSIVSTEVSGAGEFLVRLRAVDVRGKRPNAALREPIFALVGSFAEPTSYVEERDGEFVVVTGIVEGQSRFASHGHVVRIVLER